VVRYAVNEDQAPAGEAKSYFTGEDKIIIAKQRSGPAGAYIKVRFDGPRRKWEGR
jgi:replicative DNA helicase